MNEETFSGINMTKFDAVKELFDAFANRTMAYNFPHLIYLVTFGAKVKTVHTFTENLEMFKVCVFISVRQAMAIIMFSLIFNITSIAIERFIIKIFVPSYFRNMCIVFVHQDKLHYMMH